MRCFRIGICILTAVSTGCAQTPGLPFDHSGFSRGFRPSASTAPAIDTSAVGRIGVIGIGDGPEVSIVAPGGALDAREGNIAGVIGGGAIGGAAAGAGVSAGVGCAMFVAICAPMIAAAALAGAVLGGAIGGYAGRLMSESNAGAPQPADVQTASEYGRTQKGPGSNAALVAVVAERLETISGQLVRRLDDALTPAPEGGTDYRGLAASGIDTVIELSIREIKGSADRIDRPFTLSMRIALRAVRSRDNSVLLQEIHSVTAGGRTFRDYFRPTDGRAGSSGYLEAASAYLLGQAADAVADDLLNGRPAAAGEDVRLAPLEPRPISCVTGQGACYGGLSPVLLESPMPVLRWSTVPTGAAPSPVYDLRVVGPRALYSPGPGPVITEINEFAYQRFGLISPQHALDTPLERCASYRWSVRARWREGGRMVATAWQPAHTEERENGREGYPFAIACS